MSAPIIADIAGVVGADHVFGAGDERALPYRQLFGDVDADAGLVGVALPADVQELRNLARAITARDHVIWVCANAAANGAVISAEDKPAVVIDQRRMNRILEVNDYSAYALVEPGVSYRQLYDHLRRHDIALWIDCDGNPDNSVAASICSRQVGYTPYGNHMLMQCGMEVVLPDGELLRTGMGALPGSDTWQLTKYNFGPYLDGLFTQSDLGVISKIGLWLMPAPPASHPFMATLDGVDALAAMVEVLRPLVIGGTIPNPIAISNAAFETVLAPGLQGRDRPVPGNIAELGEWNVFAALYGTPENLALTWEAVAGALSRVDGAALFTAAERGEDPLWRRRTDLMRGVPVDIDGSGILNEITSLRLTAVAPIDGEHAARMHEIAVGAARAQDVVLACEYVLLSRTLLKRIHVPFAPGDAAARGSAVRVARALIEGLIAAGYGIVDESPSLRRLVDRYCRGTGLYDLIGRLRATVYP